jgi:hypothetical protein
MTREGTGEERQGRAIVKARRPIRGGDGVRRRQGGKRASDRMMTSILNRL